MIAKGHGWRQHLLVAAAMLTPSPAVWAQSHEVADVAEVSREVAEQVDRLVGEVASRDPELAQEIERQREVCLRDLSDGRLDHEGFTREIETFREVQREVTGRVVQAEIESRITEAAARGNTELAEQMRAAFDTLQSSGTFMEGAGGDAGRMMGEFGGPGPGGSEMSRGEAQAVFERAYQDALAHDPEGAVRMRDMFETMERGEALRPAPEMMERVHQEMERFMAERPEMADYARVEMDRMTDARYDTGERGGPMDSPEHAREAFERWASESGVSAAEVDRMRAEMERGMAEMARESDGRSPNEIAREREGRTAEFERMSAERGMEMAREWEGRSADEMAREWEGRTAEFERMSAERYFESPERSFEAPAREFEAAIREYEAPERVIEVAERERETSQILDGRLEIAPQPEVASAEVLERIEPHVADHDGDGFPESHPHEIYRHTQGTSDRSDDTCHDHSTQGTIGC